MQHRNDTARASIQAIESDWLARPGGSSSAEASKIWEYYIVNVLQNL